MGKGIKIFLAVLALVSIIISVFIIFEWGPFARKEVAPQEISSQSTLAPGEAVSEETVSEMSFTLPVDEQDFNKVVIDENNATVLYFPLADKAPIKSVFAGKIISIKKSQKIFENESENQLVEEIWLESNDRKYWANYSFLGESVVTEEDPIEEGTILATAKEGKVSFYKGTNLSLWIHDEKGEMISLSKEMFK